MSDWAVGDLAVCVDDGPCTCHIGCGDPVNYRAGQTYVVLGISGYNSNSGLPMLLLDGLPLGPVDHAPGYHSARFRKVTPDKHEACETEFVTLLKRSKRTVRA